MSENRALNLMLIKFVHANDQSSALTWDFEPRSGLGGDVSR